MSSPESLEDLITAKLASLGLAHDEGTVSFVQGIVDEESFEDEDRKSAIAETVGEGLVDLLVDVHDFKIKEAARIEEEQAEAAKKAEEDAKLSKAKKVLSPEEEEKRRKDLVKEYGFVPEDEEAERLAKAESEKTPSAVFVDPRQLTKKARKKAEAGVDILMQPNLNAAIVRGAELQRRQEDSAKAAAKREKDKGDLKKQKEDAAKAAEAKKKKAAKVERRA